MWPFWSSVQCKAIEDFHFHHCVSTVSSGIPSLRLCPQSTRNDKAQPDHTDHVLRENMGPASWSALKPGSTSAGSVHAASGSEEEAREEAREEAGLGAGTRAGAGGEVVRGVVAPMCFRWAHPLSP